MPGSQLPMTSDRRRSAPRGGFTLIEMVVAISLMALLVGIAIPVVGATLRITEVNTTRERMQDLAVGVANFYEDTEQFPATLTELVSIGGAISGWAGPYVNQGFSGTKGNIFYDSWRNAFQYIDVDADTKRLRSWGFNGTNESGGGDDIDLDVDVVILVRKKNEKLLAEINNAIKTYNTVYRVTEWPYMDYDSINPPDNPDGHWHTHYYIFKDEWTEYTHRHDLAIMHTIRALYTGSNKDNVFIGPSLMDVPLKSPWSYTLSLLEFRQLLDNTDGRYNSDLWGNDFVLGPDPVQYATSSGSN